MGIYGYIMNEVNQVKNGTSKKKMIFLSGHDDTLLTLLAPLGVVNSDCLFANYQAE